MTDNPNRHPVKNGKGDARQIALEILLRVQDGSHTLDGWLERYCDIIDRFNQQDKRLLHALIFGVLRWQARLDWLISQQAKRQVKIDPTVRMILRIAFFQLAFMERIPESAAVNTAVRMTRANGKPWAAGFVNGMLRRSLSATNETHWPDASENPAFHLAMVHSFPEWILSRWIARWGINETERLCGAINQIPQLTLRTNTLKIERRELILAARSESEMVPVPYAPEGLAVKVSRVRPSRLPGYDQGWFQVQDEAAQLIAHAAAPLPGQIVWDACAGLGTKSAHLAQLMKNKGLVMASDANPGKLQRLRPEMQRLGVTIVEARNLDLTHDRDRTGLPAFDCILLDAPCSGAGVMQRNPDIKWRLSPAELLRNSSRQLDLLERVAPHLKPGGLLVYSVCSFEPEENSRVIDAFLQKHSEFVIERPELKAAPPARDLITGEGFLSTLPHRHGMDGFFAATLRKPV